MIASIEGNVTQILDDSVVINVSGIGFKVFVTAAAARNAELHRPMAMFTHLVVREDALTLYGFESDEEKEMFNLLLGANGVGPRTAMAILSSLSLEQIKNSVLTEKPELFGRVSGVGKKTAQSIILQLQGKIKTSASVKAGIISNVDEDVIAALTGLGYSIVEAQAALQMIDKDTPDELEAKLREALKYF